MSETHIVTGLVAQLKTRMSREEVSEFNESHGDEIFVNYEGTLVYVVTTDVPSYEFSILLGAPMDTKDFQAICAHEQLDIEGDVIIPFFVSWYDASDSPMSQMKLADFQNSLRF